MQIINPSEAKKQGLKYYFTGKPCKYGHITQRLLSNKRCLECHNASNKRMREAGLLLESNRKSKQRRLEEINQARREKYKIDTCFREQERERHKKYRETLQAKKLKRSRNSMRRAFMKNAKCQTVNLKMTKDFCLECPDNMEIDHIIPVSKGGIQDICNLQWLEKYKNLSKKDKDYKKLDWDIICLPCNPVL